MSLKLRDVDFTYLPGTPLEHRALAGVSLEVRKGEVLGILGSTGSGKSTLLRVLKGILSPGAGSVELDGEALGSPAGWRRLRAAAGLVMQDPEVHLFAETVAEDVCFGPRNLGMSREEAEREAARALESLGLSFAAMRDRNPLALSLGEQRKVALAGILAMRPDYLLLDEMTSGLDGEGRRRLREIVLGWKGEGRAVALVTHELEELERLADRVAVLAGGAVVVEGPADAVLSDSASLEGAGYRLPPLLELQRGLAGRGFPLGAFTGDPDALAGRVLEVLGKGGGGA